MSGPLGLVGGLMKPWNYPIAEASSQGNDSGLSQTFNLPAGVQAGELLFINLNVGRLTTPNGVLTFPGGWSRIYTKVSTVQATHEIWVKQAVGGETTVAVTCDQSTAEVAYIGLRFSGARPIAQGAPDVSTGVVLSNNLPNPDSLTPAGGKDKYLWLACMGAVWASNPSGPPANYSGYIEQTTAGIVGVCAIAGRNLAAATEDPGAFGTTGANNFWSACTVAIAPKT